MSLYRNWFLASRPWSFSMTAISISVGSALAAIDGSFSWIFYMVTILAGIFMHAATNLINDYYDVKSGVDFQGVSTGLYRPHPLLEGKLTPRQVLFEACGLYGMAIIIGLYLAATRGWHLFWIGLAGALASVTYTAPPFKYKYMALGELSVFLMWGPLMVMGSYFIQRQVFAANAFFISLPFGLLVALVLLANNIRDISHDRSQGILTLPAKRTPVVQCLDGPGLYRHHRHVHSRAPVSMVIDCSDFNAPGVEVAAPDAEKNSR